MKDFSPIPGADYKYDYPAIFERIVAEDLPASEAVEIYRDLCKKDLFFLLYFGLNRSDVNHPWIVDRIREVEENHSDTLDLWHRESYKSTILTYALPIQLIINNPEIRICIFSHTRPIAKGFLRQIKHSLESDLLVKDWFPEIFYKAPRSDSAKWSEDGGLTVQREFVSKEATVEAWGLVDGQPISKHYDFRIYDDCVTKDSTATPQMIKKTMDAFELSHSLGTDGGGKAILGTNYHFADMYCVLRKKGNYHVRVYPATHDGTRYGRPVLLTQERLDELLRDQGQHIFSSQQLLNPVAISDQGFKEEWIRYYGNLPKLLNRYIVVDPASKKKTTSDYTVMLVIGIDESENYYLIDGIRSKLNLTERKDMLFALWKRHRGIIRVGWEEYGLTSDVEYIQTEQKREATYFAITSLGGKTSKFSRIGGLVPLFENSRFYLPRHLFRGGEDLIRIFIEDEYNPYPYCAHDDILDCMARIRDSAMMVYGPTNTSAGTYKNARQAMIDQNSIDGV